jgi:DNA-binding NarL/FixJ family response regulator
VLVLSVSDDEQDVSDALLAGACGYVLKESPVEEVAAGIRAAAAGESHISAAITVPVLRRLHESETARVRLSVSEHTILDHFARGHEDEEIADALGIGVEAVRRHSSAILTKLVRAAVFVSHPAPRETSRRRR